MTGPPLVLDIRLPEGDTSERTLAEGPVVIGRSPRADLQIRDALLSREHARLTPSPDGWRVEDLGSHNGTLLNGKRLREAALLKPGDILTVGGTQITVRKARPHSDSLAMTGVVYQPASELLDRRLRGPDAEDPEDLRRHADRLRVLLEVHQALSRPITLEELLELILDRLFTHLKPDEAAIYLRRPDGTVASAASRSLKRDSRTPFFSTHLIQEVAEKGMAAYVPDVDADTRFADAVSILGAGVRTMLAAPLLDLEGSLGMVVLASGAATRGFTPDDLELLVSLASAATLRIRNMALAEEAVERRQLADQMALARQIQQGLLPGRLPEVPGWELYAGNRPSDVVSGDFYTAALHGDPPKLALMVADVAGKGVTASLLTASLEALCAGPVEADVPPDELFAQLSEQLLRRTPPERYATAFLVVVDPGDGHLRFAGAGHPPALVVEQSGSVRWLHARGFPLGLMPDATYEPGEARLAPGDLLVLFTDGLTEACNTAEEEFGQGRLAGVCRDTAGLSLPELAVRIEAAVASFTEGAPPSDDRTLVLLRRAP